MLMGRYAFWVLVCVEVFGYVVTGDLQADINNVQDDFWAWRLRQTPEFASYAGVTNYNDLLDPYNITIYTTNKNTVSEFVRRLAVIKTNPNFQNLLKATKINFEILNDMLETYVSGFRWHQYVVGNPVSFLEGPQVNIEYRFQLVPFKIRQDFVNFLSRMRELPHQVDEMITLMKGSISRQMTNHNVSMTAVIGQLDEIINQGANSSWFTVFKDRLDKVVFDNPDKTLLLSEARNVVISDIIPAYQKLKDFIVGEYIPACRPEFGVSSLVNGAEFYKAVLQWHLSVDMTANEVHEKGLQEVERISKNMQKILDKYNFKGSIREYFQSLSANPKFHVATKEEALRQFSDIIFNRATPSLRKLFKNIPNLPVTIVPMTYDGPLGVYMSGSVDGSRPGQFQVNLMDPQSINTFDMAALSLHETVPGHHLQAIYSLNSSLPAYRIYMDSDHYYRVPFHFPFYTAYTEGWGLYAEFLGEELGVYKDDFELMGRYSGEMFRACRLVVDTGIHAKGWSRDKAVEYMMSYTSEARHNIETEIARYITWPGQACAYKIGELKLRQLRETAKQKLGNRFDVREFHSLILTSGAMPLRVLEKVINDWIKEQIPNVIVIPIG